MDVWMGEYLRPTIGFDRCTQQYVGKKGCDDRHELLASQKGEGYVIITI